MGKKNKQDELLNALEDFTSKENWDKFFTIRGSDDSFEWYADWPQLRGLLEPCLPDSAAILVPGCGNSRLSEHLYDAGFTNITNVDFSKVVISDMLRRNVRQRPLMKWRVMDITAMQFVNETFDAILDKGGLDALMEPEIGSKLGNQYLSEVKRVLKAGGKFICLTLAESHVLDLLFHRFRFGWKVSLHAIPHTPSENSKLQTFMLISEKDYSATVSQISSFINQSSIRLYESQVSQLFETLEKENRVRSEYCSGSDISFLLEDLKLGAKGNLAELNPGRRVQVTLGEPGVSRFSYKSVLLDAQHGSGPFSYQYGVFLVPKTRAHEWLYSSEEGQWLVVESSKAARLLMVLLDSSNAEAAMHDIQKDLSALVKHLKPENCDDSTPIPFMAASDGIKQKKIVHEVTSPLTGPIVVDDVIYEKTTDGPNHRFPSNDTVFRRLIFKRSEGLVQSEALMITEGVQIYPSESAKKKKEVTSKSRKKGNQNRLLSHSAESLATCKDMKVDNSYLASSYHNGIISGLTLISSYLEDVASTGGRVKAVVIGLGAGLLPMFLQKCLPFLEIEVVELDPVVLDVARDYFGFIEDERMKVHIGDGIRFVEEVANVSTAGLSNEDLVDQKLTDKRCLVIDADCQSYNKIDILIIDVDSSDSSSGLTCPAEDFVEETFLLTVQSSLSEQGLFVINLVSRSSTVKDMIFSRLKMVFSNLFTLQLEEDVNEVVFALKADDRIDEKCLSEACRVLEGLLKLGKPEWSQNIVDVAKLIKPL